MTISSPASKMSTTASYRRPRLSKPSRSSRAGRWSWVSGSIYSAHSAAWTASSAAIPCVSALEWTLTLRSAPAQPGSPGIGSSAACARSHPEHPVPRPSAGRRRPPSVGSHAPDDPGHVASAPSRRSRPQPHGPLLDLLVAHHGGYRITKISFVGSALPLRRERQRPTTRPSRSGGPETLTTHLLFASMAA
jgi:hypothetical protein